MLKDNSNSDREDEPGLSHSPCKLLPPSEALRLLNEDLADSDEMPAGSLSEVPGTEHKEDNKVYFGVRLGGLGLLLDETIEKEIISESTLCEIPETPEWFKGFINLRSQIVPVFDLYSYLNLEKEQSQFSSEYLLIVGQGASIFAISVASMPQKLSFNQAHQITEQLPYPAVIRSHCGVSYRENGLWSEWDIQRFMQQVTDTFH